MMRIFTSLRVTVVTSSQNCLVQFEAHVYSGLMAIIPAKGLQRVNKKHRY